MDSERVTTENLRTESTTCAETARRARRLGCGTSCAVEAGAAAVTVVLDLLLPTLVLLAIAALSLLVRRERLGSLGLHRKGGGDLVLKMLAFAALWSVFQLGVAMPVANHLSGEEQDLSAFDGLEGDLGMLVGLLVLSWTLAAFGEELAYRGYLLTRLREALGGGRAGLLVGVVGSSVLFGLGHTEQGLIGVACRVARCRRVERACASTTAPCGRRSWRMASTTRWGSSHSSSWDPSTALVAPGSAGPAATAAGATTTLTHSRGQIPSRSMGQVMQRGRRGRGRARCPGW